MTSPPPVLGIQFAAQFWMEVVQPNGIQFRSNPTPTAREAFNLCSSLWHMIDWVTVDPRTNPDGKHISEVRKELEATCPALSVLHDITTLSKHASLSKPRGPVASSEAVLVGATFYFGPGGPVSEHPAEYVVTLENGKQFKLSDLLAEAFAFWEDYFRPPAQH